MAKRNNNSGSKQAPKATSPKQASIPAPKAAPKADIAAMLAALGPQKLLELARLGIPASPATTPQAAPAPTATATNAAALKAWATRRANGDNGSAAALKAWATRRAKAGAAQPQGESDLLAQLRAMLKG